MTSMPASACFLTMSTTAQHTRSPSACGSTGTPLSLAYLIWMRSSGRGRLPVCVVRKRSVERGTMRPPAPVSRLFARGYKTRREQDKCNGFTQSHQDRHPDRTVRKRRSAPDRGRYLRGGRGQRRDFGCAGGGAVWPQGGARRWAARTGWAGRERRDRHVLRVLLERL